MRPAKSGSAAKRARMSKADSTAFDLIGVARHHRINLIIVLTFENTQGIQHVCSPAEPIFSIRNYRSHHTARIGSRHLKNAGALQNLGEWTDIQERDGAAGW
ncbi:protein of unknown function (plasmid) [Cupriavidus taiwanensis]|uniref:Uncharacterized protein n=1 Tax=Cupriavidus taiwanensis TaxID=164546 RepID=A0A9Q7UZK6_9BURK|nr:protein of unknown function [Cupriavidus taiwanensis]